MKYCIFLILSFFTLQLSAQFVYQTFPISEELKSNANSIVINNKIDVKYTSLISGTSKNLRVIKILNSKGTSHGRFIEFTDEFRSIQNFKGEVFDVLGNSILKIKKSDLRMSEYSSHLALGAAGYNYLPQIPTYPYYVVYEWELSFDKGIIMFPTFDPIDYFNQSCLMASYTLIVPKAMGGRFKEVNTKGITKISYDGSSLILRSVIDSVKAIVNEELMLPLFNYVPKVYFGMNKFSFAGTKGEQANWEDYGRWSRSLHNGRDILTEPMKSKIHELTDTCKTDREKVKVLYDYLGKNTRYVSIQLGIGGLQPMTADRVCKLGLGDCKGLSFFLYSMLKEINIKSVYTEINMHQKRILKDFTCPGQTDHVILQVPLPGDTLWLECTNPDIPFGYIHESIAGHDAILITDNGGQFCTLPSYPDTLNRHNIKCIVNLSPTGEANIKVSESEALRNYESSVNFIDYNANDRIEILRKILNLNNPQISNIVARKDKSAIPVFYTNYDVQTKLYGKKTGNRLFIPVNIHRGKREKYDYKIREHSILLEGVVTSDTIIITTPKGYVIEAMPEGGEIKAPMGYFKASYSVADNTITIIQTQYLKEGEYPATDNEAFSYLYNRSIKYFNDKIILRKE